MARALVDVQKANFHQDLVLWNTDLTSDGLIAHGFYGFNTDIIVLLPITVCLKLLILFV